MKKRTRTVATRTLLPTAAIALAASIFAAGDAVADVKPQGKMNVEIYGIITRALLYADDGEQSQLFHVDGGPENTRLGFAVSGQMTENWMVGGTMEYDVGLSNAASNASLGANGDTSGDTTTFGIQAAEIAFQHKSLGTITLGEGDSASVDRVASDLSGSDLALTAAVGDLAGGINFYNTATGARAVTIADAIDKIDGLGGTDRIRYDTPKINGANAGVSFTHDGTFDIGARWAGSFSGIEVALAGFYANNSAGSTTDDASYGGSVALKHGSGLSFTLASAKTEKKANGTNAPTYYWGKLGYSANLTSLGGTHFGVSYGEFSDFAQNDDEATELGFGIVQDLESIGSNLWFSARSVDLDRTGATFDDIFFISTGVLLNF